jgi:hypothetical protein
VQQHANALAVPDVYVRMLEGMHSGAALCLCVLLLEM